MTDHDSSDFDSSPDLSSPDFSNRDAEYLAKLQDYYADWKSIPSYAKLCEVFGIASKSWVKAILTRLDKAGFIERTPTESGCRRANSMHARWQSLQSRRECRFP